MKIHDTWKRRIFAATTAFLAVPASAQVDMDVMMKWMDATVIHWSVVGDFEGEQLILNVSTSGYAPVEDHVEIGFDYTSEGNGGLVGTPTITNSTTEMGALRNGADGCAVPTVLGSYEHATVQSVGDGYGGQLMMVVRTDYPAGAVPQVCTGSMQPSPARSETNQEQLVVPGIALLAMGDALDDENMRVSKDKKSLVVKTAGWTYTYTPTKVR